jgi:hypothetical protein
MRLAPSRAGDPRQQQLQAHLAEAGWQIGAYMSALRNHGVHKQHGEGWQRDCPICQRPLSKAVT